MLAGRFGGAGEFDGELLVLSSVIPDQLGPSAP